MVKSIENTPYSLVYSREGNSGKSTIVKTLENILCDFFYQCPDIIFQKTKASTGPDPGTYELKGKRLAVKSETEKSEQISMAKLKAHVGGAKISTRTHHGAQENFPPSAKFWIEGNYCPLTDYIYSHMGSDEED